MRLGYVFLMEMTPAVTVPVEVRTAIGQPDPEFWGTSYLERMAILCERMRADCLYDMVWAIGVTRGPVGFVEPRESVGWDRFAQDLWQTFS